MTKYGKRVYLSEWGTRLTHKVEDIEEYITFCVKELAKRNIEWSYYCGLFHNAWAFSFFDSEWGFRGFEGVVKALTGVEPPKEVPPTNQIINSDFELDLADWKASTFIEKGTADGQGVNGSRAIRIHVPFVPSSSRRVIPTLYQQYEDDWQFKIKGTINPNKYTLHLRAGREYRISFYAKCVTGTARFNVQLGHAPENNPIIWTSEIITVDDELKKYEFIYDHILGDAFNVRFSFIFLDRHSEVILDNIELCGIKQDGKEI